MSDLERSCDFARAHLLAALLLLGTCLSAPASAQDAPSKAADRADAEQDDGGGDIVVTGSLIRGSDLRLPIPVTTISPQDFLDRGYTSVADALRRTSFATGNVQNAENGYTQGASTVSLFGLGPGFTKFLIDGRPTVNYPALYNTQSTFFDTSAIPTALIESVEILPGGQSSLYGSDAIAGVVNIRLKKTLDGLNVEARTGLYEHGGGRSLRFALADGFSLGSLSVTLGAQYEDVTPLWAFQRQLTRTAFDRGSSPFDPAAVFSVISPFFIAYAPPPGACGAVSGLALGNVREVTGPAGTTCANAGAYTETLLNQERRAQGYVHLDYELGAGSAIYGDVLYNRSRAGYTFALQYANYVPQQFGYSPTLGGTFGLFRTFTPEEVGGLENLLSFDRLDSLSTTLGIRGKLGDRWDYDATIVHARQDLRMRRRQIRRDTTDAYFGSILGPELGVFEDPDIGPVPVYQPDLERFFSPVPGDAAATFLDFSDATARSRTTWARALTSTRTLLSLPGGDAGMALAAEAGTESWEYSPDARVSEGVFRGALNDVSGRGARRNLAAIGEVQLPVLSFVTLSGSARYDRYFVEAAASSGKASWNVAAEVTPIAMLALRARYGTAFKAPTLADLYLGKSSRQGFSPDYLRCVQEGFAISNVAGCRFAGVAYSLDTQGNRDLRPLTADVIDVGGTFSPFRGAQLRVDYLSWRIDNGIASDDVIAITQREARCYLGLLDDAGCAENAALITRGAGGQLVSVLAAKRNVTRTWSESLIIDADVSHGIGDLGLFGIRASWTYMLSSRRQEADGSPIYDTLNNPFYNTAPRSRMNGWFNWDRRDVGLNIGFERSSSTPNVVASQMGPDEPGAGRVSGWTVWSASTQWRASRTITLAVTVNNLFDRDPPVDNGTPGYSNYPYPQNTNVYGRQFLLQANTRF